MPGQSQLVASFLKQTAVYWGSPTPDGYGGHTYAEPREIACRWQDGNATFLDSAGRETVSKAQVYVGEDLVLGGYLLFGTLADLSSAGDTPEEEAGAFEIKSLPKTWDVSGKVPLRKVFLV